MNIKTKDFKISPNISQQTKRYLDEKRWSLIHGEINTCNKTITKLLQEKSSLMLEYDFLATFKDDKIIIVSPFAIENELTRQIEKIQLGIDMNNRFLIHDIGTFKRGTLNDDRRRVIKYGIVYDIVAALEKVNFADTVKAEIAEIKNLETKLEIIKGGGQSEEDLKIIKASTKLFKQAHAFLVANQVILKETYIDCHFMEYFLTNDDSIKFSDLVPLLANKYVDLNPVETILANLIVPFIEK